jgi:predicted peptidase
VRRIALLTILMALPAACGNGEESEDVNLRARGFDGAPNGYLEYLPPGYGEGAPRPLLIFLHGAGENGTGTKKALERLFGVGIPRLMRSGRWPESRPFVVLMPQHQGGYGAGGPGPLCPDAAEVDAFIRFGLERYEVDRRRVYLTGVSCGAYGLWDYLGAHTNEVVAAAVPIAGDGTRALAAGCKVARVPIWAFHGGRDSVVSVYGSIRPIRVLRMCRNPKPVDLRLTVYANGDHGAWGPTYDGSAGHDIYAWLLRHTND